jgi:cellulose synthase (UDP-forming)
MSSGTIAPRTVPGARGSARSRAGRDPRLAPVEWRLPDTRADRRRAIAVAAICTGLAIWYLAWLLDSKRIGDPILYGLLIAAETFNLAQAIGFWWTCAHQRARGGRAPAASDHRVDVLIPVFDEPLSVVEPTVAAAAAMRGADVTVWLLDDGHRSELQALAQRRGTEYLRRPDRTGAKAGNLNHALRRTEAPFVVVLDCDHVPHRDFLERTLGHVEEPGVAFVQTPQYYANAGASAVSSAAAAQQRLFFGPIARGKDGVEAMFCCGTNVVFRREALLDAGGFPERSLTEDFELSVRIHERRWRSVYMAEVGCSGLGPEDMASYVSQQQRWARGCLSAIPLVLRARLPWRIRLQYVLSATYFLSGWTLLLYMALPVVRLLFGVQPLASISADQFLLHFAPYYCAALSAVALAGSGTYTFGAFALSACNFWIHVQATIGALLRRAASFVVTPKHGARARQPRAIAPALLAVALLAGASGFGLAHNRNPATLNNVAFALLHSTVLLIGAAPALRIGRSQLLAPDAEPAKPRHRARWPRPLLVAAVAATVLVPVGIAALGAHGLRAPIDAGQQAHASAEGFISQYVDAAGRVVRHDQGGDTVSEGQAYAMLVAVALDDRARFDAIWNWTRGHLVQPNGLLAGRWSGGHVVDSHSAADADLDAARALVLAGKRFGVAGYRTAGAALGKAVLNHETATWAGKRVLAAGTWATGDPTVVNPSYFSPRAYADLNRAAPDPRWMQLAASSRTILDQAGGALPSDWVALSGGGVRSIANPYAPNAVGGAQPVSSFDAFRVAIRMAESCAPEDRRRAAALWSAYRSDPGAGSYSVSGRAQASWRTAASFVAAAAAAKAAGDAGAVPGLLGSAQAEDAAHPTYYGAAWVALGRALLSSTALGGCPR